MLSSPLASFVLCGVDPIILYNEPFADLAREKHPAAFGRPVSDMLPHLWEIMEPYREAVLDGQPIEITKVEAQACIPPSGHAIGLVLTPVRNGRSPVTWVYGQITPSRAALETAGAEPRNATEDPLGEDRAAFNEERLRLALEVGGLAIWDWDLPTGKITWSDEHFRIEGYSVGEVGPSYHAWKNRIHPDDRAGTEAAVAAARDAHSPYQHEFRLLLPNGTVRWCSALGRFFYDDEGAPIRMIGVMQDVTERRALTDSQQVLIMELQHRTRNFIGLVRALTHKMVAHSASLQDFHAGFESRLAALARVQDLLSRDGQGQRFTFDELVRAELDAHGASEGEHVTLTGPRGVLLHSRTVHTFALAIHELATNAFKYGALKGEGHLLVRWSLREDASDSVPMLHVEWVETGVKMPPPGAEPTRGGHGRELIERALPYQLQARTSFEMGADGVRCTITLPVSGTLPANRG